MQENHIIDDPDSYDPKAEITPEMLEEDVALSRTSIMERFRLNSTTRRNALLKEISNRINHNLPVKMTQEMKDLGLEKEIFDLAHKKRMLNSISRLISDEDDD